MRVDVTYLSRANVLRIHERAIGQHGGLAGVRDEGMLASCIAQPKTMVFDVERFPTTVTKAAAYCYFIGCNHPFYDGNKRTGFLASLTFLALNGTKIRFDKNEAYDVILGVAKGEMDLDTVAAMIASALERANPPSE